MNIQNLLQPNQSRMQKLHVDEIELAPQEAGSELSVGDMDVCYFVVSGYGTLRVDEYLYSLSPQSSVFIPACNPHWFSNSGKDALRLVRYYTQR